MMEVIPFKKIHIFELWERGAAQMVRPYLTEERILELEVLAFSVVHDGLVVACGGVGEYWPGRAEAWAILDSKACKKNFLQFHRTIRKFLDSQPHRRIEASVECDFALGRRWVQLLGFKLEANKLEAYLPNGKDCALYARVRRAA